MIEEELSEKTIAERKSAKIEYRTKKKTSQMFTFFATIFEIVETFLVILALLALEAVVIFKIFKATGPTGQMLFQGLSIVVCVGGFILGFILYKKVVIWVIEKYNLEDKLSDTILKHYTKNDENLKK